MKRKGFAMKNLTGFLDAETKKSSAKFIKDIQNGVYHKRTLKNFYENYPIAAAAESFKHFITTDESKSISGSE